MSTKPGADPSANQHSANQHSANQHSANQHSANQHSANQHSANQHSANQHSANQHSANQHSANQHSANQHSANQHSANQHSANQHSANQHSANQHSANQHSANQHSANQHSANQHSANQHSANQHSANQHSANQHSANQHSANQHSANQHSANQHSAYDQPWWDQRYGDHDAVWSGNPNPQLVTEAAELPPGRALDIGCGEGADSIWLAAHGWHVTGLDFSQVGLDRAAQRAEAIGGDVATRIRWQHQDLLDWDAPVRAYDLVSSQFMHLPAEQMHLLMVQLAGAVAIGGTLLVVGHDFSDVATGLRPDRPEMFFTAESLAAGLGPDWTVVLCEGRNRATTGPDGDLVQITDTVLRAQRTG